MKNSKPNIMIRYIKYTLLSLVQLVVVNTHAQMLTSVKHFDKVIVSPHIQTTFVEGDEESVMLKSARSTKAKYILKLMARP